jgi:hypothetical protein
MTGPAHDHARPGPAEQRAVLAVNRAVLRGAAPEATRQAAGDEACPECAVTVAVAFGITLAEELAAELAARLAPGAVLDTRVIRAAILDVIDRAEGELDAAAGDLN